MIEIGPAAEIKITAWNTCQAFVMHWPENEVSAYHYNPEMNIAQCMIQVPAEHFREPMINAGKHSEHGSYSHYNMEVSNNKLGIVQMNINGRVAHKQTSQTS